MGVLSYLRYLSSTLWLPFLLCLVLPLVAVGQERSTLSAEVYGYQGNTIHFDCVQSPFIRAEFRKNPGEVHVYSFDHTAPVVMLVNGVAEALIAPGDSLHLVLRYEKGAKAPALSYSGTPATVVANKIVRQIEHLKKRQRYKEELLTCLVLDIAPADRIEGAKALLAATNNLIEKAGETIEEPLAEYILAQVEASAYISYMEYPIMYHEARNLPIAEQGIGDYWHLMEGVVLRSSEGALAAPEYLSFLVRYSLYEQERKAVAIGEEYTAPTSLEDIYTCVAAHYRGAQRDGALFWLLTNFIRQGKGVERVLPLLEEYRTKYNKKEAYLQVLDRLLE